MRRGVAESSSVGGGTLASETRLRTAPLVDPPPEDGSAVVPHVDGEAAARCMRRFRDVRWAAGFAGRCFGHTLGVRGTDEAVLASLRARVPPGWVPLPPGSRVKSLYSVTSRVRTSATELSLHVGPRRLARSFAIADLEAAFESHADTVLALRARGRIFVHAAVVGTPSGAIVLPGASYVGKTTLCRALVEAGGVFFSDDIAVIDRRGLVHPYPRPLALRGDRGAGRTQLLPTAVADRPVRAALIAFTRFEPGQRFEPDPLTPGQTTLELLRHALSARFKPAESLAALAAICRSAVLVHGVRGEAARCAETLLRIVEERTT